MDSLCPKQLKILVVLPMYGGSLPIGEYCVQALKAMGHTVEAFTSSPFFSAFSAFKTMQLPVDRVEYLENSFLQVISQAVLAKVDTFAPDLVLSLAQAPLSRAALQRLRKDGVATAMWFVEDYRVFPYWRAFAPLYDFFAVIQQEPFLEELTKIGAQGLYLPMAALPSFHKPLELSNVERIKYGADVSFLGAGYPNRRVAFKQLGHLDFKIWGTEWDGDPMLVKMLQNNGKRITPEDAVKIYNATQINLNLHSSIQHQTLITHDDFVNPRTFELAACKAFQLVDERKLLSSVFSKDEVVTFSSMSDLLEKINFYLHNQEERKAVIEKSYARVLAEHTYQHRMQSLLNHIAEQGVFKSVAEQADIKQAEEKSFAELYSQLPEDIQVELQNLLTKLELPASTSFKDIAFAVRQQKGVLTSVETAVLFLDEWQKQYLPAK